MKNGRTCGLNPPKNLPKSVKKTSKIQVRRHQNRGLEGSGQLLGASWLQETSQTLRGHLLDASGEALGADCGGLSRILEAPWGPKTAQKFYQDGPRCFQDSSKTAQDPIFGGKMRPPSSDSNFHSILIRFHLKNRSLNFKKSLKI